MILFDAVIEILALPDRIRRKPFVSEFQLLLPRFRDGGLRVQGQAF
jgi:hypothetical protein